MVRVSVFLTTVTDLPVVGSVDQGFSAADW
jgi:hypothetical protein